MRQFLLTAAAQCVMLDPDAASHRIGQVARTLKANQIKRSMRDGFHGILGWPKWLIKIAAYYIKRLRKRLPEWPSRATVYLESFGFPLFVELNRYAAE